MKQHTKQQSFRKLGNIWCREQTKVVHKLSTCKSKITDVVHTTPDHRRSDGIGIAVVDESDKANVFTPVNITREVSGQRWTSVATTCVIQAQISGRVYQSQYH